MSNISAWIITLGSDDAAAQVAAARLAAYGLTPRGQRWSSDTDSWIASAQEAAQANAAVVIVTGDMAMYNDPATRRQLALFRLALQTRRQSAVNGLILAATAPPQPTAGDTAGVLDDWQIITGTPWQATAVARAHAPKQPAWPVRLGVHAQERLGVWLETHPSPGQAASGALLGVSGNNSAISFHAVGPAGTLPDRTVNEYQLQGLKFDAANRPFDAWALQNTIAPNESYFVRIEGQPDVLAIGTLPGGQPDDVHLLRLG